MADFTFTVTSEVTMSSDDLWPDGDGPSDPKVEDVLHLVEELGGAVEVIHTLELNDSNTMELMVSGPGGSSVVS